MRAARAVLWRNVWAFDVEPIAESSQVTEGSHHVLRRSGNDSRVKPGHAGGAKDIERARQILVGNRGIVIIHAGEAVDL
jgi:hypothetical protein